MKKVLLTMMLAAVLGSLPVFAGPPETAEENSGTIAAAFSAGAPALPQRRHYRRRYRRRYIRIRRRHYRRRHYRRIYIRRYRRRRY
jgi:hypothetical protein